MSPNGLLVLLCGAWLLSNSQDLKESLDYLAKDFSWETFSQFIQQLFNLCMAAFLVFWYLETTATKNAIFVKYLFSK